MEEPSVLDYLKSLLTPWKRTKIEFPASITGETGIVEEPLQECEEGAPMSLAADVRSGVELSLVPLHLSVDDQS